ncbi:hypothetical protein FDK21_02360 [Cohaesibacter sp. CAU 1516]|uniref:sugar phosphate nucleotidyltransferase n=1 Tax=Cohaesibacter sp. CAU 1516 TaxID=2576038 RepID=UPI0010FE76F0|nr:sugar phosphate nucleotidyltransferase [Cohaesibacter sp. CAU 1516]TLP48523.1 hypothetical protein FDK21_02360 [Cohaesibacter sp. CAU 1516]
MTNMPLLVLAGGFGTRLQSVVHDVPKPLAPVHGRPFLAYMLDNWRDAGIRDFVFLLHHRAEQIEAFLEDQFAQPSFEGCSCRSIIEAQPLGTGGSLANALAELAIEETFLATNADTWLPAGMETMVKADGQAMAITHVENANRYGRVQFDKNRIIAFEEKQNQSESGWINAGIYRLNPHCLTDWDGSFLSLEAEILPKLVKSGAIRAIKIDCAFIDIGVPADYEYFQAMIAEQGI